MHNRDSWLAENGQPESPLKAIRAKCLQCCCYMPSEVAACEIVKCPLHPFRMGKNPFRTPREMTDEKKAALGERLRVARAGKIATSNEKTKGGGNE